MGWPSLSDVGNAWNSVRNTVSDSADTAVQAVSGGAETVRSAISTGATAIRDTAVEATSRVSDFAAIARDRAGDLAQAGLDAGRRGVDAVSTFDVREAAATVRNGIAGGTEAARDGISTATNWSSERVGDAADWARAHVGGDGLASQVVRGAIDQVESSTRFQLGVVGGVSREVVGTVGAAGQLAVTAAEIQASPEAARDYAASIATGVVDAGQATGRYLESVADDPSRLAGDAEGAWNSASGFVGDTAQRYGQAIREGRMEEIGMDVGTVATYVVPIGGGPARGALTAAVRGGTEAAVRGGAEAGGRSTAMTVVRNADTTVVRNAETTVARSAATTVEQRGAALVERMAAGGGTAPLPNGAGRVADIAAASAQSGREIAVYRDALTGQRNVTIGAADGVSVPTGSRLIAHTQPGVGPAALTPSAADRAALGNLGQRSSAIIDQAGNISRFDGPIDRLPGVVDPVPLEAPRTITTPQGGSIDYGALDELGRPTGVTARITPDMIGTGTPANSNILPPGWSGNGVLHNEARGHLLGRQLGGSGDLPENLVTLQQRPANSPVMSGFEGQVRRAVEGGEIVDYSSTPIYAGDNLVPHGVTLAGAGTDGFHLDVTVLNPAAR